VSRVRSYKICKICHDGYDAFKAFDARGRYCSPACLAEARRRHRMGHQLDDADGPAIGPALLPAVINLGNLGSVVRLDPGLEGEERRLV
jgi:hypothetical protein